MTKGSGWRQNLQKIEISALTIPGSYHNKTKASTLESFVVLVAEKKTQDLFELVGPKIKLHKFDPYERKNGHSGPFVINYINMSRTKAHTRHNILLKNL